MSVAGQKRLYTDRQVDGIESEFDANQVAMSKENRKYYDNGQGAPPSRKQKTGSTSKGVKPSKVKKPVKVVKPAKGVKLSKVLRPAKGSSHRRC